MFELRCQCCEAFYADGDIEEAKRMGWSIVSGEWSCPYHKGLSKPLPSATPAPSPSDAAVCQCDGSGSYGYNRELLCQACYQAPGEAPSPSREGWLTEVEIEKLRPSRFPALGWANWTPLEVTERAQLNALCDMALSALRPAGDEGKALRHEGRVEGATWAMENYARLGERLTEELMVQAKLLNALPAAPATKEEA